VAFEFASVSVRAPTCVNVPTLLCPMYLSCFKFASNSLYSTIPHLPIFGLVANSLPSLPHSFATSLLWSLSTVLIVSSMLRVRSTAKPRLTCVRIIAVRIVADEQVAVPGYLDHKHV